MAKLNDTLAERWLLLTLARRHRAVAFPFPMLKDVDAYVEMEEPLPFADGPKRAFLLDVKAVRKGAELDFEIGPVYVAENPYTQRHGLPLSELVRAEGWGLSGAEDVAAFVMADGHALLLDLKAWRALWRSQWQSVYGDVPENKEQLELLTAIQTLSEGDLHHLKDYDNGQLDDATLDRLRQYGDFDATVEARDRFLALDGNIDAARSMEIDGYVHTADSASKSMWVVSHDESTLKEKGMVLMKLEAPLEQQKYVTVDARLLLQHKWPDYEAWEAFVAACVDGKEAAFPCCTAGAPCRRPDWLPRQERPVVYLDAHGREKDLESDLHWALRRAGLPALAELSDVLLDKAPKGLLPSDLRKLDARLPDALKLNTPEHLEAVAELFRQRHVSVAGHWMEPRSHAAWQLLRPSR